MGFAKKGSCGTLVALAPVTSFLPRGSAPAYSRGKFVGSCWWGVKRLSLSLSLFSSVSWRRESRTAAAAAATAPPARRSWSWWRCGAAGFGGGSDRPPAAGGGGDSQAGGWPLVVETAGGLELLAAPRSVPLGPSRHHIPLSTTAVKRDCQPVSTRPGDRLPGVAGPSPHPVCLRPGANPQAPRSFVCLLRESDCGAGSVPPPLFFLRPGTSREGVVGGSFGREKLDLRGRGTASGSRRVLDRPRRREKVQKEGCNFLPSAGPCEIRSRGAFSPGSPIGADRLSCVSQGLPGTPPR